MKLTGVRVARPATRAWNVTKTLVQLVCFWALFLFVLPPSIVGLERRFLPSIYGSLDVVALPVFALASALSFWSGLIMAVRGEGTPLPADAARTLVVTGPYRYVRNPMAVAGLSQGAAIGLHEGSVLVLLYVLAGGIVWNTFVRRWEEDDLAARFGASFEHYRGHVRCWLPRLTPYVPQS